MGWDVLLIISRVLNNKGDVIASDQRERSNLVFASERSDCFVASLLAMTKSDFFSSLLEYSDYDGNEHTDNSLNEE
jgi:hypothetical protein